MKKLTELIIRYKELILYVFFGVLNTAVNFTAFWLWGKILGEELYYISNALAWLASVIFAYLTNKLFVFESKSFSPKTLLKEIPLFFGARVFSFCVEEGGLIFLVDGLHFGDFSLTAFGFEISGQLIAKISISVIVVIINYVVSKFAIFKKKA